MADLVGSMQSCSSRRTEGPQLNRLHASRWEVPAAVLQRKRRRRARPTHRPRDARRTRRTGWPVGRDPRQVQFQFGIDPRSQGGHEHDQPGNRDAIARRTHCRRWTRRGCRAASRGESLQAAVASRSTADISQARTVLDPTPFPFVFVSNETRTRFPVRGRKNHPRLVLPLPRSIITAFRTCGRSARSGATSAGNLPSFLGGNKSCTVRVYEHADLRWSNSWW